MKYIKKPIFLFFTVFLLAQVFAPKEMFAQNKSYYTMTQRTESEEFFEKGYYYFNNRDYEAALDFFRKSLTSFPKNEKTAYWLGKTYLFLGYKGRAIDVWEKLQSSKKGDVFLSDQLNKLYSEDLKKDSDLNYRSNYVFLRYINSKSNPVNIAIDSKNYFYVSDFFHNKVDIYNADLKQVKMLRGDIDHPYDIQFYKNLMFVSCFGGDKVVVYDSQSYRKITEIGGFGFQEGKLAGPTGMTILKDKIYIVDQGNHRVQVFQLYPKPYFVSSFGEKGSGEGQLFNPTDIVFYENKLWVVDKGNHGIQIFDTDGNYLDSIKSDVVNNPIKFLLNQNHLYLLDSEKGLFLYNSTEKEFSLVKKPGDGLERFSSVAIDPNGVLFFSENTNPKIVSYSLDSMKLTTLNFRTMLVSNTAFPRVVLRVRIQDNLGKDIIGLTGHNFTIMQDGYKMTHVNAQIEKPEARKLFLTVLVRSFSDMKSHTKEMISYIEQIFPSFNKFDKIRLVDYNTKSYVDLSSTNDKLLLENKIKNIKWKQSMHKEDGFDSVLYDAIHNGADNDSNSAVLLLDNGKSTTKFSHYTVENIGNYANVMGVPVYAVVFNEKDESADFLKELESITKLSGGLSLNYYKSNNVYDIVKTIRKRSPVFYTLSYLSPLYKNIHSSLWANVDVTLKYRSLYGKDKIGYYIPQ